MKRTGASNSPISKVVTADIEEGRCPRGLRQSPLDGFVWDTELVANPGPASNPLRRTIIVLCWFPGHQPVDTPCVWSDCLSSSSTDRSKYNTGVEWGLHRSDAWMCGPPGNSPTTVQKNLSLGVLATQNETPTVSCTYGNAAVTVLKPKWNPQLVCNSGQARWWERRTCGRAAKAPWGRSLPPRRRLNLSIPPRVGFGGRHWRTLTTPVAWSGVKTGLYPILPTRPV